MTEQIIRIIHDSGDYIDVEITHVETQSVYFATLTKVEYNTRLFREKLGKKLRDEFDELVDANRSDAYDEARRNYDY